MPARLCVPMPYAASNDRNSDSHLSMTILHKGHYGHRAFDERTTGPAGRAAPALDQREYAAHHRGAVALVSHVHGGRR